MCSCFTQQPNPFSREKEAYESIFLGTVAVMSLPYGFISHDAIWHGASWKCHHLGPIVETLTNGASQGRYVYSSTHTRTCISTWCQTTHKRVVRCCLGNWKSCFVLALYIFILNYVGTYFGIVRGVLLTSGIVRGVLPLKPHEGLQKLFPCVKTN